MADDTLLTFCPPAPCARIAEHSISLNGMVKLLLMTNIIAPVDVERPAIMAIISVYDEETQCG
jgi:hypothetical protein